MFNFKSFAAVAVAAASVFAQVPAAQAQPQLTAGQEFLVTTLMKAGVTLEAGTCDTTDSYGFYVPDDNYIAICTNVAVSQEDRWSTLRHEAVHVAQKCVNPSMTSMVFKPAYISQHANESDWSFIQRAYDPQDHYIELEAFTLERRSNAFIAAVVSKACNIPLYYK